VSLNVRLSDLPVGTESFNHCMICKTLTLQTVVKTMLYSPGGARSITVWSCENHPTPDSLVDE
jgi:hypothetical protein